MILSRLDSNAAVRQRRGAAGSRQAWRVGDSGSSPDAASD